LIAFHKFMSHVQCLYENSWVQFASQSYNCSLGNHRTKRDNCLRVTVRETLMHQERLYGKRRILATWFSWIFFLQSLTISGLKRCERTQTQ